MESTQIALGGQEEEAIFRSAEMSLIQLFIPLETARETMYTLGSLGLVQFRDLNKKVNSFQRSFVKEIRRLDEIERQYRFFRTQLDDYDIPLIENPFRNTGMDNIPKTSDVDDYVENAKILEQRITQLIESLKTLELRKKTLVQQRYMLATAEEFFADDSNSGDQLNVEFVAGIIPQEKIVILERILWRTLRGNLLFKTHEIIEPIYEPESKTSVRKSTFIVLSHGAILLNKIRKIAESLDADLYDLEYAEPARSEAMVSINSQLADIDAVLDTTNLTLQAELTALSQELLSWNTIIMKEKSIYQSLNLFNYDRSRKILVAEGWAPTADLPALRHHLFQVNSPSSNGAYQDYEDEDDSTSSLGSSGAASRSAEGDSEITTIINILSTTKQPPTYHRLNQFTSGFQAICDAYGVPTYREVNPGLPTIVTFPFMFAIMFGDLGHGFILTLIGLAIVLNQKSLSEMKRGDILDMAYSGRYIVLLMGVCSLYTGFLYNDIFSLSMTWFKSGWKWPENFKKGDLIEARQIGVYPIGIDPIWHGTENGLLFLNSYKMKLSIVMGYLHMLYSYMFSLVNFVHFDSIIDIFGNFIPGFLFMNSIFGYLSVLIIYKWCVDWIAIEKPAPSLLNTLISMFLSPGTVDEELYSGQAPLQVFFLIIALICVPCLLFLKPLYLKRQIDKKAAYEALTTDVVENGHAVHIENDDDDEEAGGHSEEFGDIMIHQVIHTIEFCLNCVSHTASYLRLWALSLAHAQLSQVLWSMTLANSFGMTGIFGVVMTVILFTMWFVLTCAVLVAMEGTSAMLHSLRLHWVESMSKFFEGEGYAYQPFSFKTALSSEL
ncbi:H(+)-transporting V0 sector ATPase subunit A [Saccharomycopsis crataegensis]|uniref:V-type proton ATPase subunit a n=1 Tax=Saccharomycopsis crataegensis TaxID=43959 RepID=A0AAV5QH69_9ASCO|nr:H(+)-transporting V0 sector ATPase subunit A [Saccharomycopsis crataegensis]